MRTKEKWATLSTYFKYPDAVTEERRIPTEFINDKPLYPGSFFLCQQLEGSQELGENPSGIYISYKKDRCINLLGKAHVHQIILPQVQLHRTSCPFYNDYIRILRDPTV